MADDSSLASQYLRTLGYQGSMDADEKRRQFRLQQRGEPLEPGEFTSEHLRMMDPSGPPVRIRNPKQGGARQPQYGARAHSDEAQDRKLILSLLKQHGIGKQEFRGQQAGARGHDAHMEWFKLSIPHRSSIHQTVNVGRKHKQHGAREMDLVQLPPLVPQASAGNSTTDALTGAVRNIAAGWKKPDERSPQAGARGHHPRMHSLAKASAKHLYTMGHMDSATCDAITGKCDDALSKRKGSFGSLAPAAGPLPKKGVGHYLSTPIPTGDDEGGGV